MNREAVKKTLEFLIVYILIFIVIKLLIFKEDVSLVDWIVVLTSVMGACLYNYFRSK